MKIAVQSWINRGQSGKNRFVCFQNSYHGDTVGAMSVCDPDDSMHAHFKGYLLEQFPHPVPRNNDDFCRFDAFLDQHRSQLAGVIIEPLVQMAAGMRFHSAESLSRVAALSRQHELVFITDEIGTGFHRTGPRWAHAAADVRPDILCLGKALTGGTLPMAVTLAQAPLYATFHNDDPGFALMHGPTFMGNPLACAAALASLDLFEREPRAAQAACLEQQLSEQLEPCRQLDCVVDVRSRGAIGVVQFDRDIAKNDALPWFVEQGTWIRPLRDVVYLAPALTIDDKSLRHLTATVNRFARRIART